MKVIHRGGGMRLRRGGALGGRSWEGFPFGGFLYALRWYFVVVDYTTGPMACSGGEEALQRGGI